MGENENLNAVTEETNDGFMDGWDSPDTEVFTDGADRPEGGKTEENAAEESEQQTESGGTGDAESKEAKADTEAKAENAGTAAPAQEKADVPKAWNVKYMGEEKVLTEKDITPEFLQKAMDYDRIRGKYDEAKPTMELFAAFAKEAGMSVGDYMQYLRTEVKKAAGMDEAAAKREIALEDREAAVTAKEAAQNESRSAAEAQKAKVDSDLKEFKEAFPNIYEQAVKDPKAIPETVWTDVQKGMSLTAAYARYAVAQAEQNAKASAEKAQSAEQNVKNASRTTGSMKSAGSDSALKDDFLMGFGL